MTETDSRQSFSRRIRFCTDRLGVPACTAWTGGKHGDTAQASVKLECPLNSKQALGPSRNTPVFTEHRVKGAAVVGKIHYGQS